MKRFFNWSKRFESLTFAGNICIQWVKLTVKSFKASDWLREKTKGQKVFLKYDAVKYDSDNRLMAYLYLQKTKLL